MSSHEAKRLENWMQNPDKEKKRGFASSSDPSEEVYNGILRKKA